jgi:hypothetical protein
VRTRVHHDVNTRNRVPGANSIPVPVPE